MSIYVRGHVLTHSHDLIRLKTKDMIIHGVDRDVFDYFELKLLACFPNDEHPSDCTLKICNEMKFQHFLLKFSSLPIWPIT